MLNAPASLGPVTGGYLTLLASIAVGGIALALFCVLLLHVNSREFNPITRAMSDYANGHYGWLMQVAFVGLGSSLLALAEGFRQIATTVFETGGVVLVAAAGALTFIAGLFPIDNTPDGGFTTSRGAVHAVAGYLLSPVLVGGMLCLSLPRSRLGNHPTAQSVAQGLAVVSAAAFVVLLIVNSKHLAVGGIGQRIFMALVCSWLLVASFRLLIMAS